LPRLKRRNLEADKHFIELSLVLLPEASEFNEIEEYRARFQLNKDCTVAQAQHELGKQLFILPADSAWEEFNW